MTIEINEQTDSNSYIRAIINQYNRCRIWIRCPQCIGGSMYHEGNGEYVSCNVVVAIILIKLLKFQLLIRLRRTMNR